MNNRVQPLSTTLKRLIEIAEKDLDDAHEASEAAYQAGGTLARMRVDARPHPTYRAWGNGWADPWKPGEYEAAVDAAMDRFDAEHRAEEAAVEAAALEAGARVNAASRRLALLIA